ncbi:unnamed protein product, partial [Rotaria magnacalcarata]
AIDEKVRINRAQKQLEEAIKHRNESSSNFLKRISTRFKPSATTLETESNNSTETHLINDNEKCVNPVSVSLAKPEEEEEEKENNDSNRLHIAFISNKRTSQHQQQSNLYDINEDTHGSEENQNDTSSRTNTTNYEGGKGVILIPAKL